MYLSYNEFVCTLSKVTSATSVTGQKYYDIHIIDNLICGKRGIGTSFQIKLAKLYNAYIDYLLSIQRLSSLMLVVCNLQH